MEMISNTADTQRFCIQVAADRRNVGVQARPNVAVEPLLAIFGAELRNSRKTRAGESRCQR